MTRSLINWALVQRSRNRRVRAINGTSLVNAFVIAILSLMISSPILSQAYAQSPSACPRATLPAYAHNDYENAQPLVDALALGFRGIEADVFLVDGELRVGHDRHSARAGQTFEALYLAPLSALAKRCDAFAAQAQPFFVAIELKESSEPTYAALVKLLAKYRELLIATPSETATHAPLEIVLVGWHPTPMLSSHEIGATLGVQHRITRSDSDLPNALDPQVRLISVDYGKTIGRWWVTPRARARWFDVLAATKRLAPDRLLRVHNVPVDARIYTKLRDAGVDLIGTKQLQRSARILDKSVR